MSKKRSLLFWGIFWITSILVLVGWYAFLQYRNEGFAGLDQAVHLLPLSQEMKGEAETLLALADMYTQQDNKVHTFLLLFQNNWELRPGGGYIGSFGILKVQNGNIIDIRVHDTANFDGRIPDTVEPPYPMGEMLHIPSWKLRDANYSPDFPTNAQKVVEFYEMGNGEEEFEGVIGITANVLMELLAITGPVQVEGFPGVYDKNNAVDLLQYQVEQAYVEQGVSLGDRKEVMNPLSQAIMQNIFPLSLTQKKELAQLGRDLLASKDIQIYFYDEKLQHKIVKQDWAGKMDSEWKNDFLGIVDANLGAFKSDPVVSRLVEYTVDFTQDNPTVTLAVTYHHTAQKKDWKTNHYQGYSRIYVPQGAWLIGVDGHTMEDIRFEDEFGKKVFGHKLFIPIGESKTYTFEYALPKTIEETWYDLKVFKQSGSPDAQYHVTVIDENGGVKEYEFSLYEDVILSERFRE